MVLFKYHERSWNRSPLIFFKALVFFLRSVTHNDTETTMSCSIYFFNLMPQIFQVDAGWEQGSEVSLGNSIHGTTLEFCHEEETIFSYWF